MEDDFTYLVFVAEKLLDLGDWSRQNLSKNPGVLTRNLKKK